MMVLSSSTVVSSRRHRLNASTTCGGGTLGWNSRRRAGSTNMQAPYWYTPCECPRETRQFGDVQGTLDTDIGLMFVLEMTCEADSCGVLEILFLPQYSLPSWPAPTSSKPSGEFEATPSQLHTVASRSTSHWPHVSLSVCDPSEGEK